jgi:FMN phosphatase YigB (HAD superfamily)
MTLEQLGVAPQNSVFLDDAPGNIVAARAAGMHAILVEDDHSGAFEELDRLLAER